MAKSILVTGSEGYIGRHVVRYLSQKYKEFNIFSSDIHNHPSEYSNVTICDTPIFGGDSDIFNKLGKPDILIHLAWRNGFKHDDDSHIKDMYSHYRFIKDMLNGGLKSLTVMGSMHEVGYFEGAIDENTPCSPLSLYGISKLALRNAITCLCKKYSDVSFKWTRAYYITGDDGKNQSIFAKILGWEAEGKKTFPFTSGKNLYDFIDVDELAQQISEAALQTDIDGIIECCTGTPLSLADRVENFIKEKGLSIKPEYGVFPDRAYDSPGVWGSPEKIKAIMKK